MSEMPSFWEAFDATFGLVMMVAGGLLGWVLPILAALVVWDCGAWAVRKWRVRK